jgi:anti-sigma B factor antagonist
MTSPTPLAPHALAPARPDRDLAPPAQVMQLQVDSRTGVDGGTEIELRGEIDLATVNTLRSAVIDAVAAGARRVHLLLDGVTYIDSSGLGTLVGAHRRLAAIGGELVVRCDLERVLRLFRMTGIDQVLTVQRDESACA